MPNARTFNGACRVVKKLTLREAKCTGKFSGERKTQRDGTKCSGEGGRGAQQDDHETKGKQGEGGGKMGSREAGDGGEKKSDVFKLKRPTSRMKKRYDCLFGELQKGLTSKQDHGGLSSWDLGAEGRAKKAEKNNVRESVPVKQNRGKR